MTDTILFDHILSEQSSFYPLFIFDFDIVWLLPAGPILLHTYLLTDSLHPFFTNVVE